MCQIYDDWQAEIDSAYVTYVHNWIKMFLIPC